MQLKGSKVYNYEKLFLMVLSEDKKIEDLMLGGLKIIQSDNLYRFTSDAVLLARFSDRPYNNVLDMCAGSGIVGLHYYGEFGCEKLDFLELQKPLADMCQESVLLNGLQDKMAVINCDLKDFDGKNCYDAVFCNPPYKKSGSGILPEDKHIAICRAEVECNLSDIVKCAYRSLKCGGHLLMCHKPERLTDVITCFRNNKIEPCRIRFITGKNSKDIYLFLIDGVKDKKPAFKLEGIFENNATDFKG